MQEDKFVEPICSSGKRCYPSEKEAKTVLNKVKSFRVFSEQGKRVKKKIGKKGKKPTRAYWCEECNHWHLTSKVKKEDRKTKKIWRD